MERLQEGWRSDCPVQDNVEDRVLEVWVCDRVCVWEYVWVRQSDSVCVSDNIYRVTQKNGNFWKTQQKLKKSKKKKLLTEIEPLQLAF